MSTWLLHIKRKNLFYSNKIMLHIMHTYQYKGHCQLISFPNLDCVRMLFFQINTSFRVLFLMIINFISPGKKKWKKASLIWTVTTHQEFSPSSPSPLSTMQTAPYLQASTHSLSYTQMSALLSVLLWHSVQISPHPEASITCLPSQFHTCSCHATKISIGTFPLLPQ